MKIVYVNVVKQSNTKFQGAAIPIHRFPLLPSRTPRSQDLNGDTRELQTRLPELPTGLREFPTGLRARSTSAYGTCSGTP